MPISKSLINITTNYNVSYNDNADVYVINASATDIIVNLQDIASNDGFEIAFARVDSSYHTVTIKCSGSQSINDALSFQLNQYDYVYLMTNANKWIKH